MTDAEVNETSASLRARIVLICGYALIAVGFVLQYVRIGVIHAQAKFQPLEFIAYYVLLPIMYILTIRTWRLFASEGKKPIPASTRRNWSKILAIQTTILAVCGALFGAQALTLHRQLIVTMGWSVEAVGGITLAVGYFSLRNLYLRAYT